MSSLEVTGRKYMKDTTTKDQKMVYEIGYLIVPSVAEEKLEDEVKALFKILNGAGAAVIAEEMPHKEQLAYTMRKKTVSGAYEKFDSAYFGWVKFEVGPDAIGDIKRLFEKHATLLRMLVLSTVKENTYLGKRASAIAASFSAKTEGGEIKADEKPEVKKEPTTPASIEEMDKSIDEMVKVAI